MTKLIFRILAAAILVPCVTPPLVNFWFAQELEFVDPWPVEAELLAYFKDTYEENRAEFRDTCATLAEQIPGTQSRSLAIASSSFEGLTIDICEVPGNLSDRLVIVTSGVHGVEGYATSAVQRRLMSSLSGRHSRPDILLVHGVNPAGMKMFRRVSENNVDLNRNFDREASLFQRKNAGYLELNGFLNPSQKADLKSLSHLFFPLRAIFHILTKGMGQVRQAVIQGQYEVSDGIFFGGKNFEQQKDLLDDVFRSTGRNKAVALVIDLHTGYGERGECHLFANPPASEAMRELAERVFRGYNVIWGDRQKDFYSTYGNFASYLSTLMPETRFISTDFEFGTLNTQTTRGSIQSIDTTILENQSFHSGCASPEDCEKIRHRFREMFYPSSPSWRTRIMKDSEERFAKALDGMSAL